MTLRRITFFVGVIISLSWVNGQVDEPINETCVNPRQQFYGCGDICPRTCENLGEIIACPAVCRIPGECGCKPEYVKHNGKCILPEECPPRPTCDGVNEKYYYCASKCSPRCLVDDGKEPECENDFKCIAKCDCLPGYVRDENDVCILKKDCPPFECTLPNMEYQQCGGTCFPSCQTVVSGMSLYCQNDCVPGCACVEGYTKNNEDVCVKISECPHKCYDARVWNDCGSACPKLCKTKDVKKKCSKQCVEGCFCKPGLYYSENDFACYEYNECPPNCNENEWLDNCADDCPEETCKSLLSGTKPKCPPNTFNDCKKKCKCQTGFVRNDKNKCVPENQCCNDPNAEMVSCPNPCKGGTCLQTKFSTCKTKCKSKGCQCKKGFVKTSQSDNKCIALKKCPKAFIG